MINFKKLFKNNEAVSPVIGVVLMVAITVILAAAVGSSVFGKGPAESAPQANIDVKAVSIEEPIAFKGTTEIKDPSGNVLNKDTEKIPAIRIEHLGGDSIEFKSNLTTRVTATVNNKCYEIYAMEIISPFEVGNTAKVSMIEINGTGNTSIPIKVGDDVNIKIADVASGQLICNKNVKFHI